MSKNNKTECLLCRSKDAMLINEYRYDCPFCGEYNKSGHSGYVPENELVKYRYMVKKHQIMDVPSSKTLSSDISLGYIQNRLDDSPNPNLLEKIERVLDYIESNTTFLFEKVEIDTNTMFPLFFCKNNYELYEIIKYLINDVEYITADNYFYKTFNGDFFPATNFNKLINIDENEKHCYERNYVLYNTNTGYSAYHQPCYNIALTPKGLKHQTDKQYNHLKSKQAFVAMWFNEKEDKANHKPNMSEIYTNAIKPAIEETEKFSALKINDQEHCNDINDEMIAQIRKSRFMVVDLTGYRGGVYWEAGFAYGLGMPVIYTCHEKWEKSDSESCIEGVHFDLNHRNIIFWNEDNLNNFKQKLRNRIEAIVD